jgi:hypothetical protein
MATADVRTVKSVKSVKSVRNVTSFWNVFVRMLLTCVAALGFTTSARRTRSAAPAATATPAAPVAPTATEAAAAPGASGDFPGRLPGGAERDLRRTIPAPRGAAAPQHPVPYPPRRDRRNRTLPPTMKQRITAEAHGATPAARSVLTAEAGAAHLLAPVAPAALSGTRTALIPAPRARAAHEALCD